MKIEKWIVHSTYIVIIFFQIVTMFADYMGIFFYIFGIPLYLKKVHGLQTENVKYHRLYMNTLFDLNVDFF